MKLDVREISILEADAPPNFEAMAIAADIPFVHNGESWLVVFEDVPGDAEHPLLSALRRVEIMFPRHNGIILRP